MLACSQTREFDIDVVVVVSSECCFYVCLVYCFTVRPHLIDIFLFIDRIARADDSFVRIDTDACPMSLFTCNAQLDVTHTGGAVGSGAAK